MEIKAYINDQIGADLRKGAIARFNLFQGFTQQRSGEGDYTVAEKK